MAKMELTNEQRKAAAEARAEVIAAFGTDKGYDGMFFEISRPCPRCVGEGIKNKGGRTPNLRLNEQGEVVCHPRHGKVD